MLNSYFCPPPFLIDIFAPIATCHNDGVRAAGEKCSAFFGQILYILSQLGKKYAYFLPAGEKICISPLFPSPFNNFFPNMLFGHIFASNRKIYNPVVILSFLMMTRLAGTKRCRGLYRHHSQSRGHEPKIHCLQFFFFYFN